MSRWKSFIGMKSTNRGQWVERGRSVHAGQCVAVGVRAGRARAEQTERLGKRVKSILHAVSELAWWLVFIDAVSLCCFVLGCACACVRSAYDRRRSGTRCASAESQSRCPFVASEALLPWVAASPQESPLAASLGLPWTSKMALRRRNWAAAAATTQELRRWRASYAAGRWTALPVASAAACAARGRCLVLYLSVCVGVRIGKDPARLWARYEISRRCGICHLTTIPDYFSH